MPTDVQRHIWHLRKQPVFAALPAETLLVLAEASALMERPRRTPLYAPGDLAEHVFFLHGGRVSVLHTSGTSRPITLAYHGPGDVFGESCLWNPGPRDLTAITTTAVLCSPIPRATLGHILDGHPAAQRALFERAVLKRDAAARRLCAALSSNVTARLAGQLVDLAEQGPETHDGRGLPFVLAHRELAALIGTTRETVSLELRRFETAHLIRRQGRQILLCDIPRLRALADQAHDERQRAA